MNWEVVVQVTFYTIAVLVSIFFWWVILSGVAFFLKCRRCGLHVASVKPGGITGISATRYELLGSDTLYSERPVCSVCWQELAVKGFPRGETWWTGATVEYLKNTPNSVAVLISVGSLIVAIIALLT